MSDIDPLSTWPTPVQVGEKKEVLNLTQLNKQDKEFIWKQLKTKSPDVADLLTAMGKDSQLQDVIAAFDCSIRIYAEDLK